ncbi:MAG TPA: DUF1501 domain-containing protein, partial [Pirellulales bacterium]
MIADSRQTKPCCPGRAPLPVTRRQALATAANGFGLIALAGLMPRTAPAGAAGETPAPHFLPRAKRVIFCFMDGGVSHVDSFDPKPALDRLDGKPFHESKNPTANGARQWLKCPWFFKQHGESGLPVSELFPHIARHADDLAVIRSMKAD